MKHAYCVYFDHNYVTQGVLTIRSLRRFDAETPIFVLALSNACELILRELALPNVSVILRTTLEEFYPELKTIKQTRKQIEYYFTLTPFLPHYVFKTTAVERVTYRSEERRV